MGITKILLLLCCVFFSYVIGQATYCGDNIVPGATKVNCFGVVGCLNQSCINQTCVTVSLCPAGQVCNMYRGTCQPAKKKDESLDLKNTRSYFASKKISKNTNKHFSTNRVVTSSTNLLINGDFEEGMNGWRMTSTPDCPFVVSDSSFSLAPSHENQIVFMNYDACMSELSQEFEIPYTDCITHFDLSFFLGYSNYAGIWIPGNPNWGNGNVQYQTQEFYIEITDLGNNHILEQVLRPNENTPPFSDYMLYNFSFESKRFLYDIPNFPRKLRLSIKPLAYQTFFVLAMDDIRLFARCLDGTAKKDEESKEDFSSPLAEN